MDTQTMEQDVVEQGATADNRTRVERMAYVTGQYLRRAGVIVVDGDEGLVSCVECLEEWQPTRRGDGRFISWDCPNGCSSKRVAALDALGLQPVDQKPCMLSLNLMPVVETPFPDEGSLLLVLTGAADPVMEAVA